MIVGSGVSPTEELRILRASVSATRMAMAITDPRQPDNPIVLANDAFVSMTGYSADEILGRNCRFLQGPDTDQSAVAAIREALRHHRGIQVELMNYRRDGSPFLNQLMIQPIFDEVGSLVHFFASQIDITAHRQAEDLNRATEQRLRLIADELNHRVRNTLSTVQAIVRQTVRNAQSLEQVSDIVGARLVALGDAHEALTQHNWEKAELDTIVRRTIQPHDDIPDRFCVAGPKVYLSAKQSLAVAMAVHELCTNATKYGALSVATGRVEIGWTINKAEGSEGLRFTWREHGGPAVSLPGRTGFGSSLIRQALSADLNGDVDLIFDPDGVICTFDVVLSHSASADTYS